MWRTPALHLTEFGENGALGAFYPSRCLFDCYRWCGRLCKPGGLLRTLCWAAFYAYLYCIVTGFILPQ